MTNVKAVVLGGLVALLGVVAGEGIARADCDRGSYATAQADAFEGELRGMNCEVIELENGTFEAQCDEVAFPDESEACSAWVEGFDGQDLGPDAAATYASMYEACMTIAIHTPGAVH